MLLRVRVTLPDRPGALGQVARTLGVAGADIVQVVVLERLGGRAVDDFTVVWPGEARVESLLAGLTAIPGVRVDGVWRALDTPIGGGHDAELLAQLASNPADGIATLVDAAPGLLAADWAAAVVVPADWAARRAASARPADGLDLNRGAGFDLNRGPHLHRGHRPDHDRRTTLDLDAGACAGHGDGPAVVYASWRAPAPPPLPDVTPLRARAMTGPAGNGYAIAPFGKVGLVLVIARTCADNLPPAAFHRSEVDRIAQLVRAAAVILGDAVEVAPAVVA